MYNVSVPMALMDYIPVIFYGFTFSILCRDLFGKMSRQNYTMFSAGTVFIFLAGLLKATWKLLYGAGICDFQALNNIFLPLVLKGCVDWAKENGVTLIDETHMKIINDKRAKEKAK